MLAFQNELCPELPPVMGNRDYRDLKALLLRIDDLVIRSGVEVKFVASFSFERRRTERQRVRLVRAFRCTLLRILFGLSYRRAARELATNYLYQKFCGLLCVDRIVSPSHSALERYEKMVSPEVLQSLMTDVNHEAAMSMSMSGDG